MRFVRRLGNGMLWGLVAVGMMAPAASAAAGTPGWSSRIALTPPSPFSWPGEVATVTTKGELVAAWTQLDANSRPQLFAAAGPAGGPLGSAQALGGPVYGNPPIATDDSGDVTLAVDDPTIATYDRPAGGSFGAPADIEAPSSFADYAVLAKNPAGEAAVLFMDASDGEGFLSLRPPGGSWQSPIAISNAHEFSSASALALTPGGDAIMAWSRSGAVIGRVLLANGTLLPEQTLSDPALSAWTPAVGADGRGNAIITWAEGPAGSVVGAARARIVSPGGAISGPIDLSGGRGMPMQATPAVAAAADGSALISWQQRTALGASGWTSGGPVAVTGYLPRASFSPPVVLTPVTDYPPVPALDSTGDAAVFFEDGATNQLQVAMRSGGGAFSPPQSVACPPPVGVPREAAFDPHGNVYVFWTDSNPSALLMSDDAPATAQPVPCAPNLPPPIFAPVVHVARRLRVRQALARGVRVALRDAEPVIARVTLAAAGLHAAGGHRRTLAQRQLRLASGRTALVTLRIRFRGLLAHAHALIVTVTITSASGVRQTSSHTIGLRRG